MMMYVKTIGLAAYMFVFLVGCGSNDAPKPVEESVLDDKTYTQGEYTLIFKNNDPDISVETREEMVKTFFIVYPKLAERYNTRAPKTVTFMMDTKAKNIAAAGGSLVTYQAKHMRENPQDTDVVTHEVMHLVQAYKIGPGWLIEGIADYARYTYGVKNTGWSLQPRQPNQNYTDGYGVTGNFLVWLQENKREDIVDKLNTALYNQSYTEGTWVELTESTVYNLWSEYYYE